MTNRNHTLLQGLLRSGITVAEVVEKYHLRISRNKRHPSLIQFKYDQIDSDLNDPLVRQCRGIILDESDNWEIIARPFDKFFNYGEPGAAEIDWRTARVLEKLDGTCCILYYYQGWHVATLGSCDASGPVGALDMTFHDLFWSTFTDKGYVVPDLMWSGVTFIFELTTPYNRVVVPHAESDLKLIGARIASGDESCISAVGNGGNAAFEVVKSFPGSLTMNDLQASFNTMEPTAQEGYVVVDANYNRIKVKHPGYVRIHHLKDSFTLRNIVECVRNGEDVEFINYFPEHAHIVTMVKDSFFKLITDCTDVWLLTEGIKKQKDFAQAIEGFAFKGVLFAVRNGKRQSFVDALQQMHIDSLINLLEVEDKAA